MFKRLIMAGAMVLLSWGIVAAERMTVNVDTANIRSGPDTRHDVLWKVELYHPIDVIKKSGGWYEFKDYEGDRGWIYAKLVTTFPSVIVLKDKCNVRTGPSTDNDVAFTVERGVPFRVLEKKESWLHIRHADGDSGWIYAPLVW